MENELRKGMSEKIHMDSAEHLERGRELEERKRRKRRGKAKTRESVHSNEEEAVSGVSAEELEVLKENFERLLREAEDHDHLSHRIVEGLSEGVKEWIKEEVNIRSSALHSSH